MVNSEEMNAVGQRTPAAAAATPLAAMAEAFEELVKLLKQKNNASAENKALRLVPFCDACALVSVLFGCLGLAFKFAELEYISKLHGLEEASKTYDTLQDVLDLDVANDAVRAPGSFSRNLRRVRQGLELIRAMFENFLFADDSSLKDVASTAYARVCGPYHSWAVRTAVYAGMYTLPTRDQLLLNLNETNQSAEKKMKRYIDASFPVIEYIDELYLSRDVDLDW